MSAEVTPEAAFAEIAEIAIHAGDSCDASTYDCLAVIARNLGLRAQAVRAEDAARAIRKAEEMQTEFWLQLEK